MLNKRKTILNFDDSSTIRTFVSDVLLKNGFQTLESETMEAVFSDMARMHFDLAAIDIFMPGMGGIAEIARSRNASRLSKSSPFPPVSKPWIRTRL